MHAKETECNSNSLYKKTSDLNTEFSLNYIAAIQANLYMTDLLCDNSKCKTFHEFSKEM